MPDFGKWGIFTTIDVALVPDLNRWRGSSSKRFDCVVVVDVLRATSTIVAALGAGAIEVRPVVTVEEALSLREHGYLVCGEVGSLRPEYFDLGNSPTEYTEEVVRGRKLCLRTTNGAAAIHHSRHLGEEIFVGSFLNLSSTATAVAMFPTLLIVCSGNEGAASYEDLQFAGALISKLLVDRRQPEVQLSDEALIALDVWRADPRPRFVGEHARKLKSLGFSRDLEFCQRIDTCNVVVKLFDETLRPL